MKSITNASMLLAAILFFSSVSAFGQQAGSSASSQTKNASTMKSYLIEREIPNAGKLTPAQLKDISKTSCSVLKEMGPGIQWIQSYVTGDKIFCVYKAENEDMIREHGKKGGFPVTKITEISSVISPATAEN
ncbi:MAG TPA: DUF4242 domain-containing protein [Chitinophagaceae bacterium]